MLAFLWLTAMGLVLADEDLSSFHDAMQVENLTIVARWELEQARINQEAYREVYNVDKRAGQAVAEIKRIKSKFDFEHAVARTKELTELIQSLELEKKLHLFKQFPKEDRSYQSKVASLLKDIWKSRFDLAKARKAVFYTQVDYHRNVYDMHRRSRSAETLVTMLETQRLLEEAQNKVGSESQRMTHAHQTWKKFEEKVKQINEKLANS